MNNDSALKLLFIINPGSGASKTDWSALIREQCNSSSRAFRLFELPKHIEPAELAAKIKEYDPSGVIAVGGDGTVNLVAKSLLNLDIPMGILPAGSANGMAKELGIPSDPEKAITICMQGVHKKIHLLEINDQLCIHLSDIGFNAYVTKKFKALKKRGLLGYIRAGWRVFRHQQLMRVDIQTDTEKVKRKAIMVVIANATTYGTGIMINPEGKIDDELFEVIIVQKISFFHSVRMLLTKLVYEEKTEVLQARSVNIKTYRPAHFQVDGEYLGRVSNVKAGIIPDTLTLIVPPEEKENNQ